MTLDVPLSVKVEEWRQKAAAGTLSLDEMKAAVSAIRQGRIAAASVAKSRPAKAAVDLAALESELDGL